MMTDTLPTYHPTLHVEVPYCGYCRQPALTYGDWIGGCDYCGATRPVEVTEDPYSAEIEDDATEHVLCEPCYHSRAMDI